MVIPATIAAMAGTGLVTWWMVRRWPQHHFIDPGAEQAVAHGRLARTIAARTDPTKATGLFLTVAGTFVAAGALGVAVVLRMVRRDDGFARFDRSFARWGADEANSVSTDFLEVLTWFGSTPGVIVVAVVAGALAFRRSPTRALVAFLALVVAGQLVLTNTIKAIVGRERPDFDRLTSYAGPSFPSGHAAAAAACFAAAALVTGRRRSLGTKAILAGIAAAMAAGVATSRVLLGVHWFTDVVAGVLVGWGWFALCSIAFGGRLLRFGAPARTAAAEAEAGAEAAVAPIRPRR